MNIFLDVLQDTVSDSLHMLPFLFAAFLLIETLEHYSTTFINQALIKINKAGPLVGAILGCIPQCGSPLCLRICIPAVSYPWVRCLLSFCDFR